MVADWHALMSEYENPKEIKGNTYQMVRDWIACGIDPDKSIIFLQSAVPEHLELAMIFADLTPLSWLERCPTYKEQLKELEGRQLTTYGFLGYPVLQTADIAVYKANRVPVGVDQLPHLELAREIIRRFHFLYGNNIFPEPEPILTDVPKLLGLDNRKMSKSYNNYIALSDPPELIRKKVAKMITDPSRIRLSDRGYPDVCSAFSYFNVFADKEKIKDVMEWCTEAKKGCVECKKNLAEILVEYLEGIRTKRSHLKDKDIEEILDSGNKKVRKIAEDTMGEVREIVGLLCGKG